MLKHNCFTAQDTRVVGLTTSTVLAMSLPGPTAWQGLLLAERVQMCPNGTLTVSLSTEKALTELGG